MLAKKGVKKKVRSKSSDEIERSRDLGLRMAPIHIGLVENPCLAREASSILQQKISQENRVDSVLDTLILENSNIIGDLDSSYTLKQENENFKTIFDSEKGVSIEIEVEESNSKRSGKVHAPPKKNNFKFKNSGNYNTKGAYLFSILLLGVVLVGGISASGFLKSVEEFNSSLLLVHARACGKVGTTEPIEKTFLVHNPSNRELTLDFSTDNWTPVDAYNYIDLTWDYNGESIKPGELTEATCIITIDQPITGLENYGFDVVIIGITS